MPTTIESNAMICQWFKLHDCPVLWYFRSMIPMPVNLQKWISEHKSLLKPPVGNCQVFHHGDFIIMAVGGPNARKDYHINQSSEFFYQLEGTINVRVLDDDKPIDIPLTAGEVFLLPPNTPHSPQRPTNSVGLVIEHKRKENELDGFLWICENCNSRLFEEKIHVSDIVKQLPQVFEHFYADSKHTTCKNCGTVAKR